MADLEWLSPFDLAPQLPPPSITPSHLPGYYHKLWLHESPQPPHAPTMATASPTATPKLLKKLEKEVLKEGKTEEKSLKHAMKELSELEKSQNKAQKVQLHF
ncbi:hypothetical protein AX16_005269, partial [Volvariella volvacea WC 439]